MVVLLLLKMFLLNVFELYLCFYLQKIHINKNPVF